MLGVAVGLASQQLLHRGTKLIGALLGVCVAVILMFTQLGFKGALYDSAVNSIRALDADIILTSREFQTMAFTPPWMPIHLLHDAQGVGGVASARPLYAATVQITDPRDGRPLSSWLFAFPPDEPVFRDSDINSQIDLLRLPQNVIIDRLARIQVGEIAQQVQRLGRVDVVVPIPQSTIQPVIRIVGLFQIGPTINVDGNMITSDLNFYRTLSIPLDRVSLGVVRVADGYDPAAVRDAIQQRLGPQARVFLKNDFIDNEQEFWAKNTPIGFVFNLGLAVGILVGIVFVSQTLHGIVADNMREYATLRAMGYSQNFFVFLVGSIAVAIGLITYAPSAVVSYFIFVGAASVTKLPMQLKPSYMIEVFIIVVGMGLIATVMSTKKLKKADPVDLF